MHYTKENDVKVACQQVREMIRPGYIGKLFKILKGHNYTEKLITTSESIAFIKSIQE